MSDQLEMWGTPPISKKTTAQQQQVQPPTEETSLVDRLRTPVTANSTAAHVATQLNMAHEEVKRLSQRVNDLKGHVEFLERRFNKAMEQVSKDSKEVLSAFNEINKLFMAMHPELAEYDSDATTLPEQLSSPETEAAIYDDDPRLRDINNRLV